MRVYLDPISPIICEQYQWIGFVGKISPQPLCNFGFTPKCTGGRLKFVQHPILGTRSPPVSGLGPQNDKAVTCGSSSRMRKKQHDSQPQSSSSSSQTSPIPSSLIQSGWISENSPIVRWLCRSFPQQEIHMWRPVPHKLSPPKMPRRHKSGFVRSLMLDKLRSWWGDEWLRTCQVRVSRFYLSCFLLLLLLRFWQPRVPDLSGHCRASTASSGSQWALRTPDLSGHWETPTARANGTPNVR